MRKRRRAWVLTVSSDRYSSRPISAFERPRDSNTSLSLFLGSSSCYTAIKIQRQVGGNLAELLDTVAATMREREYVRRQVNALAAEGKLSAWVLGGLPPLFMVYLLLTNYDYVIIMFQKPLGWAMLAGAATILGIGIFWMSRLIKVEV